MPRTQHITAEIAATVSSAPDAVTAVCELATYLEVAGDMLPLLVRRARTEGATWAEIAAALGVTTQAAQQRFGH